MSTSIAKSTSSTVVALLNTVNSVAQSVTQIVDTGASSIDMLDRYVQRAKHQQIVQHKVEDHHWQRNLFLDSAKNQAKIEDALERELHGNANLTKRFNENLAELEALFTEITP